MNERTSSVHNTIAAVAARYAVLSGVLSGVFLLFGAPVAAGEIIDLEFGNVVPNAVVRAGGDWSVLKASIEDGPFLKKRIEGRDLQVLEAVTMESQPDANTRFFVVLDQPTGYTWRFLYDTRDGKPEYSLRRKGGVEVVEVDPPGDNVAFFPSDEHDSDIVGFGLHRYNSPSCTVSGVPIGPCIVCYCGSGSICDSDDTGVYTNRPRPVHFVSTR